MPLHRVTNLKFLRFSTKASIVILLRLLVFLVNLATASILARSLDFKGRSDIAVLQSTAGISVILATYVAGEEIMRRKQVTTKGIVPEKVRLSLITSIFINFLAILFISKSTDISLYSVSGLAVLFYILGSSINSILLAEHFSIHGLLKQQTLQVVYHFVYLFMLLLSFKLFSENVQNWLISMALGECVLLLFMLNRRKNNTKLFQMHISSHLALRKSFNREVLFERLSVIQAAMLLSALILIMNSHNTDSSLKAKFVIAISISTLVYMPFSSFFPLLITEAKRRNVVDLNITVKRIFVFGSVLIFYLLCSNVLIHLSIPILFGDKYSDLVEVSLLIVLTGSLIGILIAFSAYFRGLRDFAGGFIVVSITLVIFSLVTTLAQESSLTLFSMLQSLVISLLMGNCFAICRMILHKHK